jgi:hypothetical protein
MALGKCRECEYEPVASGARCCPRCAVRNPNPTVADRIIGRGAVIGFLGGAVLGGVWGSLTPAQNASTGETVPIAATIAVGVMMGGFLGVLLGFVTGLILSSVAWVIGKR